MSEAAIQRQGPTNRQRRAIAFNDSVGRLRQQAEEWIERPKAPEAGVLTTIILILEQIGQFQRDLEENFEETRAAVEAGERARNLAHRENTQDIREKLQVGVDAVSALRTINEKVVEKKLLEIVAAMTRDLKVSIENQATAMTSRYRWETHFRFLSYCSLILVFGFVLGRFT